MYMLHKYRMTSRPNLPASEDTGDAGFPVPTPRESRYIRMDRHIRHRISSPVPYIYL